MPGRDHLRRRRAADRRGRPHRRQRGRQSVEPSPTRRCSTGSSAGLPRTQGGRAAATPRRGPGVPTWGAGAGAGGGRVMSCSVQFASVVGGDARRARGCLCPGEQPWGCGDAGCRGQTGRRDRGRRGRSRRACDRRRVRQGLQPRRIGVRAAPRAAPEHACSPRASWWSRFGPVSIRSCRTWSAWWSGPCLWSAVASAIGADEGAGPYPAASHR